MFHDSPVEAVVCVHRRPRLLTSSSAITDLVHRYSLPHVVDYLLSNAAHTPQRVALQFPDDLLCDAVAVCRTLQRLVQDDARYHAKTNSPPTLCARRTDPTPQLLLDCTNASHTTADVNHRSNTTPASAPIVPTQERHARSHVGTLPNPNRPTAMSFFVIADGTFASCCADEITAQHYRGDCIVHFGVSCMSKSSRIPVFYVAVPFAFHVLQSWNSHATRRADEEATARSTLSSSLLSSSSSPIPADAAACPVRASQDAVVVTASSDATDAAVATGASSSSSLVDATAAATLIAQVVQRMQNILQQQWHGWLLERELAHAHASAPQTTPPPPHGDDGAQRPAKGGPHQSALVRPTLIVVASHATHRLVRAARHRWQRGALLPPEGGAGGLATMCPDAETAAGIVCHWCDFDAGEDGVCADDAHSPASPRPTASAACEAERRTRLSSSLTHSWRVNGAVVPRLRRTDLSTVQFFLFIGPSASSSLIHLHGVHRYNMYHYGEAQCAFVAHMESANGGGLCGGVSAMDESFATGAEWRDWLVSNHTAHLDSGETDGVTGGHHTTTTCLWTNRRPAVHDDDHCVRDAQASRNRLAACVSLGHTIRDDTAAGAVATADGRTARPANVSCTCSPACTTTTTTGMRDSDANCTARRWWWWHILSHAPMRLLVHPRGCVEAEAVMQRRLRQRSYHVETLRASRAVGILVASLAIAGYDEVTKLLHRLLRAHGKRSYVIYVGHVNEFKLANFVDTVDCFVVVACPNSQQGYFSCKQDGFMKAMISPAEVVLALSRHSASGPRDGEEREVVDYGMPCAYTTVLEDVIPCLTRAVQVQEEANRRRTGCRNSATTPPACNLEEDETNRNVGGIHPDAEVGDGNGATEHRQAKQTSLGCTDGGATTTALTRHTNMRREMSQTDEQQQQQQQEEEEEEEMRAGSALIRAPCSSVSAARGARGALARLHERHYVGLDPCVGQTAVQETIVQGKHGIARGYAAERMQQQACASAAVATASPCLPSAPCARSVSE